MSREGEYQIGKTGRVKAAGVPLDVVFDPTESFRAHPSVEEAQQICGRFTALRQAPPDEIRDRFFPRKDENKGRFRTGSLMLRPILKTDQGAGKFLAFDVEPTEQAVIHFNIRNEMGYVIPEAFFEHALESHGNPKSVQIELETVVSTFAQGNIKEAQLAYERMQIACDEKGIVYERDAAVGRDALFFIRPASPIQPIVLPSHAVQHIEEAIALRAQEFTDRIMEARNQFARKHNRVATATQVYEPLYFQTDLHVSPNGSAVIDEMHFPDVGLFLTSLESNGNEAFQAVRDRVIPLRDMVIASIIRELSIRKKRHLFLITRPEVIHKQQDVLEVREIRVLTDCLAQHGIATKIITPLGASTLTPEDVGLLLNVNPNDDGFEKLLLHRLTDARTPIFPDPFLLLAKPDMTGYQRVGMTRDYIDGLAAIVKEAGSQPSAEKFYMQLMALDNYLSRLGFNDDVFHMHISSQTTPVPCFRFDPRGFQIAINYIKSGDAVELRVVPIDPNRSVLFELGGRPLYSVFRFMSVKGGI